MVFGHEFKQVTMLVVVLHHVIENVDDIEVRSWERAKQSDIWTKCVEKLIATRNVRAVIDIEIVLGWTRWRGRWQKCRVDSWRHQWPYMCKSVWRCGPWVRGGLSFRVFPGQLDIFQKITIMSDVLRQRMNECTYNHLSNYMVHAHQYRYSLRRLLANARYPRHSHLLWSVWQWNCCYLFKRYRSVGVDRGLKPDLPYARKTLWPTEAIT